MRRLILVWLLWLTYPVVVGAQSRVFYDGFETGAVSSGWTGGAPCPVVRSATDGGTPANGSYQAECNWNGATCLHTMELAKDPFPGSTEYLIRYRYRMEADMDKKAGSKMGRIGFSGGANGVIYTCQMEQGAGASLYLDMPGIGTLYGTPGGPGLCGDGQWHQIEHYIKTGSAGAYKVWNDDVQIANWAGNISVHPDLYVHSNWSCNTGWEHDAANHEAIDEVEIYSNATTGTAIAAGTMAAGTASVSGTGGGTVPTAPTNLRIVPALGLVMMGMVVAMFKRKSS